MELAANRVDPSFERDNGELIARRGHGRCMLPLRRALRPIIQIQYPVIGSIRVAVRLDPAHVVQLSTHERKASSTTRFGEQGRRGISVFLDVVVPHFGDRVPFVATGSGGMTVLEAPGQNSAAGPIRVPEPEISNVQSPPESPVTPTDSAAMLLV